MDTLIAKGKGAKKPLVVAGCVPQGSRNIKELDGVSIVGVQQIDRVVEIVEETLKGHEVRLLSRKTLPALDLPKVHFFLFISCYPFYHISWLSSVLLLQSVSVSTLYCRLVYLAFSFHSTLYSKLVKSFKF